VLVGAAVALLPAGVKRSQPATPALAVVVRTLRAGHAIWAAGITLVSAGVLGLVEVVAPLDLDERLGLSASGSGSSSPPRSRLTPRAHRSAVAGAIAAGGLDPPSPGWA
jgi:hypothetical protein